MVSTSLMINFLFAFLIIIFIVIYQNDVGQIKKTKWFIEQFKLYKNQCYCITWGVEKVESKNPQVTKTDTRKIKFLSK